MVIARIISAQFSSHCRPYIISSSPCGLTDGGRCRSYKNALLDILTGII